MFGNSLYDIPATDPRVKAAVAFLQQHGAPANVAFVDEVTEFGFPNHVVRFLDQPNGRTVYEATAGCLMAYPSISFIEMRTLGLIA